MKIMALRTVFLLSAIALASCGRGPINLALTPPGLTNGSFPACLAKSGAISSTVDLSDKVAVDADLVRSIYERTLPVFDYGGDSGYVLHSRSALSGYLDCLLGNASDDNVSAQLVRGHIMLTLMAQYGAEIVHASRSDRQPAQALRLISHIREAELMLVAGSDALAPPAAAVKRLDEFWLAARIASELQVAVDIETVYFRRSLDLASNLAAALGSGPAAAVQAQQLLARAGQGLALTQKSQLYGSAFIADSRSSLVSIGAEKKSSTPQTVKEEWGLWSARLDAACADLATAAKLSDPSCRPTKSAVMGLRAKMGTEEPFRDDPPVAKPAAVVNPVQ